MCIPYPYPRQNGCRGKRNGGPNSELSRLLGRRNSYVQAFTRCGLSPRADYTNSAVINSSLVTVAVPNLPTTMPAAQLLRLSACSRLAPAASARASVLTTVSPAPLTSKTCAYSWDMDRLRLIDKQRHPLSTPSDQHGAALKNVQQSMANFYEINIAIDFTV